VSGNSVGNVKRFSKCPADARVYRNNGWRRFTRPSDGTMCVCVWGGVKKPNYLHAYWVRRHERFRYPLFPLDVSVAFLPASFIVRPCSLISAGLLTPRTTLRRIERQTYIRHRLVVDGIRDFNHRDDCKNIKNMTCS